MMGIGFLLSSNATKLSTPTAESSIFSEYISSEKTYTSTFKLVFPTDCTHPTNSANARSGIGFRNWVWSLPTMTKGFVANRVAVMNATSTIVSMIAPPNMVW